MSTEVIFDVEQLLFERLQQGSSLLGKHILESLDAKAIRKWLAMQIYKSEFSASPQKRNDDKCLVHLYDEASVPITSVSVDYVMGKMVAGGFISVPVVIQDSDDDVSTGVIAASYLNTSIHQSKVVDCPGFVLITTGKNIKCMSVNADGNLIRSVGV